MTAGKAPQQPRRRMPPANREDQIIREAVTFFARYGFDGQTRELAKAIGVTQPLLYRYFPTKDALIERVYEKVFVSDRMSDWESWLADADHPLATRLERFYRSYAEVITSYEWVRLFMFAGLRGLNFNRRYLDTLRDRIFRKIIGQLRIEVGSPSVDELPMTEAEMEAIWGLHASIYYLGVRQHIYNLPVPDDREALIAQKIRVFLGGVKGIIAAPSPDRKDADSVRLP